MSIVIKKSLLILLITCFFLCFFSNKTFSDEKKEKHVTLKLTKAPLKKALKEITGQTKVVFIYSDTFLKGITVTCDFINVPVDSAITKLLKNTELSFKRKSQKRIVIVKKKESRKITIQGQVVDGSTGETLPYANIIINGTHRGTTTNTVGRFTLLNVPVKSCTLEVRYIGYLKKTIFLRPDSISKNILVKLQQTVVPGKGIIVQAENWEIFQITDRAGQFAISPTNFANLPVIGNKDISRSLQLMPGISSSNYGSSGLHIRGGRPSQNLVLLDGMTLYHMNHSFGFFNAFNEEAIKDVRIYKSGFPAKFGGRLSGVMELTSKTGDLNRARLSYSLNQMSTQAVLELPVFGKGAFLLSARRSLSSDLFGQLYNKIYNTLTQHVSPLQYDQNDVEFINPLKSDKHIYFYDLIGKVTILPTTNDIFSLSFYSGFDNTNSFNDYGNDYLTESPVRVDETNWVEEVSKWGNNGLSGKWYHQWHKKFNTTAFFSYSDYFVNYHGTENVLFPIENTGPGTAIMNGNFTSDQYGWELKDNVKDFTIRFDNSYLPVEKHSIEFGTSVTRTGIILRTFENLISVVDSSFNDEYEQSAASYLYSMYLQDSWKINRAFSTQVGIRTNYYTPTATINWEPRYSFHYSVAADLTIKASWGRYYQYIQQFRNEIEYINSGISWVLADGKEIKPMFADQSILGWKYEKKNYLCDFELYYKRLRRVLNVPNERQFFEPNFDFLTDLQKPEFAYGFDLLLKKKTGLINGWISYSYSKTKTKNIYEGGKKYYPTDLDAPHNLKIVGNCPLGKWNFSMTWHYISGKPYTIPNVIADYDPEFDFTYYYLYAPLNRNQNRLPATHRLNLSVTRKIANRLFAGKIGFSVFNLYDQKNVWYRYFTISNGKLNPVDVNMIGITPTLYFEVRL